MKHKKVFVFLLSLLVFLVPLVGVTALAFSLPPVYGNTFLGEMPVKFDRLTTIDEPKVVIVGGSSVAFGLDSAALEETVGMPVVNYGLYATLGTKFMIDTSKAGIGEGDIVILAPEVNEQTYSLYFNSEAVWQAMDGDLSMLRYIPYANWGKLAGGLWNYAGTKYSYIRDDYTLSPSGIYAFSSFDEYGDIAYGREFNIMVGDYDPTQLLTFDLSLLDEDFIDYVNDYAAWCEKRGAKLYFGFSPMNAAAVTATDEEILTWYSTLATMLDCDMLSDVRDYIMDAQYFYDTNFHLNDTGVTVRTHRLGEDLLRTFGDKTPTTMFLPAAPKRPNDYFSIADADDTTGYFRYEDNGDTMTLVGITDTGKEQETLTLPISYEGKPVTTMAAGALEGCTKLRTVIVPKDTSLTLIYDGAFAGAGKLSRIEMEGSCAGITVADDLLQGTPSDCRIYVSHVYYGDFAGDYFWSKYMQYVAMG